MAAWAPPRPPTFKASQLHPPKFFVPQSQALDVDATQDSLPAPFVPSTPRGGGSATPSPRAFFVPGQLAANGAAQVLEPGQHAPQAPFLPEASRPEGQAAASLVPATASGQMPGLILARQPEIALSWANPRAAAPSERPQPAQQAWSQPGEAALPWPQAVSSSPGPVPQHADCSQWQDTYMQSAQPQWARGQQQPPCAADSADALASLNILDKKHQGWASGSVVSQAGPLHERFTSPGTAPPSLADPGADAVSPATDRLQAARQEMAQLLAQRAALRAQLGAAAAAAGREVDELLAQARAAGGGDASSQAATAPLPQGVPALVAELLSLDRELRYAQAVQELAAVTRALERGVRGCERAAASGERPAFLEAAGEAVAAHSAAAAASEALAGLPGAGLPQALAVAGERALARAAAAQDRLVATVRSMLAECLTSVGWPPPVTAGIASGAGAAEQAGPWTGLADAGTQELGDLTRVVAASIALQRSVQGASFDQGVSLNAEGEPPALDALAGLAAPLGERLRFHFAAGRASDRPERPEWLFDTALRMARCAAPGVAPLGEALAAHGLQHAYHMPFELARALRAEVQGILRDHVLPRLERMGGASLWLHFAEEAARFERTLAPLRGLLPAAPAAVDDAPEPWAPSSCFQLVYDTEAWRAAWWAAERGEAERRLDTVLDSPEAWARPPPLWQPDALDALDGPGLAGNPAAGGEAWRCEFWAPVGAEAVVEGVTDLARRAAWLPHDAARRDFAVAAPQEVLRGVRARLGRLARTAEEFRDLTGPVWAPRMGAYACAAHWLEHALREPCGPLLLLDVDGGESGRPSPLAQEADAFAGLRQKLTLRLARATASVFADATAVYRRRASLDSFADPNLEDRGGAPSPKLVPALEAVAGALERLSGALDGCVFRDMWRAMAVAATRLFFNEVATEARFSPQGAAQFAADCNAVASVLAPYTPRPAAFFRELSEACALLQLAPEAAAATAAALTAGPDAGSAALQAVGVRRLTLEQAVCVLAHRA